MKVLYLVAELVVDVDGDGKNIRTMDVAKLDGEVMHYTNSEYMSNLEMESYKKRTKIQMDHIIRMKGINSDSL